MSAKSALSMAEYVRSNQSCTHSISSSEQSSSSYHCALPSDVVGSCNPASLHARSKHAQAIVVELNRTCVGVSRLSLRYDHASCEMFLVSVTSSILM